MKHFQQSFKRRSFLKLMGVSLGAGLFSFPRFAMAHLLPLGDLKHLAFELGKPKWTLHDDGTFDIFAGDICLSKCRPTIDGQSIFVRNTFMGDSPKGKRIIYEIDGGFVMLDLKTHANTISIGAEISGMKFAPSRFCPLGEGHVSNVGYFFKQGFGTGGQSGVFPLKQPINNSHPRFPEHDAWSYDSYLMTALISRNANTLSIGAYEQGEFVQRCSIYNRPHRMGLDEGQSGKESVFFDAGFDTENIPLKDEFLKLPDLFVYFGTQPFGTLQYLAWGISEQNKARYDMVTNYFWSSYQSFGTSFGYNKLLEQLKVLDETQPPIPLRTVQIGRGYCVEGDWHENNNNWPDTMENVAREIFKRKYRAGIYVAPFVVHESSNIFKTRQRWLLKGSDDKPLLMHEDANGKLYALDAAQSDVKNHLGKVFKHFHEMGFTYYEIDYLDWGLQSQTGRQKSKKGQSSVQVFRAIIETIREAVGPGSFITANRTPYSPIIGLVDAVRIGDNQARKWDDDITGRIIEESYNTQYFNNVLWQNDPDVVFLRDEDCGFSKIEKRSLALWTAFLGGSLGIADSLKTMTDEMLQLWRFIEPATRPQYALLPFWGCNVVNKVAVRVLYQHEAWSVLVFNDSGSSVSETYLVADLIGKKEIWVFVWEPKFSFCLGELDRLSVSLAPHETRLFYLSDTQVNPSLSLNLSGN